MKEIQANLLEDQGKLQEEHDEAEHSCTQRVPSLNLNLKGVIQRIDEMAVKIPPLESKLQQKELEIGDKQSEIDFAHQALEKLEA